MVLAAGLLNFRKTLSSNGCTKGTHAGEVLIQVSSRLRTRRISEENEFRSRTKRQAIYSLLGKFSLWRLRGEVGGDEFSNVIHGLKEFTAPKYIP